MNTKQNRGFTLIELLVVIAIIGILSAVVLASLSTARSKGNDASIKANLHTVETQSAVFLSDNGNSYGTLNDGSGGPTACPTPDAVDSSLFGDANVKNAIAAALNASGGGTASCFASTAAYAVAVSRPAEVATTTSPYWCVDNTGAHCGTDALTGSACGACITTD